MKTKSPTESSRACIVWERIAWATVAVMVLILVVAAVSVIGGSMHQPEAGMLSVAFSDSSVLIWLTVASVAHLFLIPAFCVGVALRNHRRSLAGIPVPKPRSVWSGHKSVFGTS